MSEGSLEAFYIDSDIYISGDWVLESSINLAAQRELHLNDANLDLDDHTIYAPSLLTTGRSSVETSGGKIITGDNVILNSELRLPTTEDVLYIPQTADVINAADVRVSFFSRINTCGTDPGQVPFTIDAQPISDYNGENISCNGVDDGEVQAFVTGGVGPFTFQWFGGSGVNNMDAIYSGNGAGSLAVLVTDLGQTPSISCVDNVQLTEPAPLAIFTLNLGAPTCADVCDGSAFPIVLGGTGGYSFDYSNGNNNQIVSDLCANDNTLTVSDINNCTIDTLFNMPLDTVFLNLTYTDTLCFGDNSGSASVVPDGGAGGPYEVLWNTTATSDDISGLAPGTYSVEVTDNIGCSSDSTFQIVGLTEVTITTDDIQTLTCPDDVDGFIEITITGGEGPYTQEWLLDGNPFSIDEDLSGIGIGTYNISVEDDFGCTQDAEFILEPDEVIEIETTVSEIDCFGSCNAAITTNVITANLPFTYVWSDIDGVFSNDPEVDDLCPGNYTLEFTDGSGCTETIDFEILEPEEIQTLEDITDVSCNTAGDGSILLEITGGTGPYSADVAFTNPSPTSVLISNLDGGTYNLTITDADGCFIENSYTVEEPEEIIITPTVTEPSCAGVPTGSISIDITGGTIPYSIEWVELAILDQTDVTDLAEGTYTVIVTDANDCEQTALIDVTDPEEIVVTETITDVRCNGALDGTITLLVENADDPLDILWTGDGVNPTSQDQTDLAAGDYNLFFTDANGCEFTADYTIVEPEPIDITETLVQPDCFGDLGEITVVISGGTGPYSIDWTVVTAPDQTTISNLNPALYEITVTDSEDCVVSETYEIIAPDEIQAALDLTQPTCLQPLGSAEIIITGGTEPYSIEWTDLAATDQTIVTDLAPGDYEVTVTDANLCETTELFTINEVEEFTVTEVITDVLCFGASSGAIDLTVVGQSDPLTILWTGNGVVPTSLNQSGLEVGTYTVELTDNLGCDFTADYIITQEEEIVIDETVTQPECTGPLVGEITIVISGGTEPYSTVWPEAGLNNVLTINDLISGDYGVLVTDANDCVSGETYTIDEVGAIDITSNTSDVTCNGDDDGAIELIVTGQIEPLTVVWTPDLGTSLNQTDLAPGIYGVELTDADGCTAIETFEITEPEELLVLENITQATCPNPLGEIDLTITGGTEPYNIVWAEVAAPDQTTITDLTPGEYTVTITDANDCEFIQSYTINELVDIEITEAITQPGCDGALTGAITIEITGGLAPFSVNWPELAITDVLTVTDLLPGDYTVEVTDQNLCLETETYTITEPGVLGLTSTVTDVTCNGEDDGTISLVLQDQVDPITVVWTPDLGTNLNQVDLAPGTYEVEITDADGCAVTDSFDVTEPETLEVTEAITQGTCADPFGDISISITGGTEPYTMEWLEVVAPNQTNLSDLAVGIYTVTVTDANDCEFTEAYEIEELSDIEITEDITQPGCTGAITGEISITIIGGDAPYSINWPELGETDVLTVADVPPGDYTVEVTDANLCTETEIYTITQPGILDVSAVLEDLTCAGNDNGSISLEVTGQVDPLTITWTPNVGTGLTVTDLEVGNYTVEISDADGCSFNDTYFISEPDLLEAIETITQPTCIDPLGEITINVIGGTAPYSIVWAELLADDQLTITDLAPGTYNVTITDANDCVFTAAYVINSETVVEITEDITQPGCTGATVGEITISLTNGTEPYDIQWPELALNNVLTADNLLPGTYSVVVTDANDCTNTETYTITEPGVLDVTSEVTEASCFENEDGSISLEVTGQIEPLTVVWTPDLGTDLVQTDLASGDYTVQLTDADGCAFTQTYEITEPEELLATDIIIQPTCAAPLGEIALTVTGGTEPYNITWAEIPADGQLTITDLAEGSYNVTILDANDCLFTAEYVILAPADIEITEDITQPGCTGATTGEITITLANGTEPYSISWPELGVTDLLTVTDLLPGDYTVEVTSADNCTATETYTITEPGVLDVQSDVTDVSCNGEDDGEIILVVNGQVDPLTVAWTPDLGTDLIQNDLPSGTYSVSITDADGCAYTNSFEILEPVAIEVTETINAALACSDDLGSISIEITGGTEPYIIEWTGVAALGQTLVEDLPAGVYSVQVTDANDCTVTEEYTLTAPAELGIDETITQPLCLGELGSIETTIIGGTEPYTIQWTGSASDQQNLTDLTGGVYTLTVTDANDCELSESYTIDTILELEGALSVTQPECFFPAGSAEVVITGGTEPYEIDWTVAGAEDLTEVQDLSPGNYTLTITDANNCIYTEAFTIDEAFTIAVAEVITDTPCNAQNIGSIDIEVSGTNGDYTVSWSGPNGFASPVEDISNLEAGDYTLIVNDDLGCELIEIYTVGQPDELIITLDEVSDEICLAEENGAVSVTISGGTLDYTTAWISGAFTSADEDLIDLSPGNYTLNVEDANGCQAQTTVTIEPGAEIDATVTTVDSTCGNSVGSAEAAITSDNDIATISWTNSNGDEVGTEATATDLSSGVYTLEVTDDAGCTFTQNIAISDSDAAVIDADITPLSCLGDTDGAILITVSEGTEPYQLTWIAPVVIPDNEFNPQDLPAGEYIASVTDAEGCMTFEIIEITDPEGVIITETVEHVSCNGLEDGSISLELSGGTEEYTVTWTGIVSDQLNITDLAPGEYTVEVVDAQNCNATETYTITEEPVLDMTLDLNEVLCAEDTGTNVDISVTGGTLPYSFEWTGDISNQLEDQTNLGVGNYTVTVTDAADCVISEDISITQVEEITLEINQLEPNCLLEDGELSATAAGGSGAGYSFFWYDTIAAPVLISEDTNVPDLGAGTYFLEVIDNAGCSATQDINLSNNQGDITADITDIDCAQDPTGAIDITVLDLQDPLGFNWNGPNDFTSADEDLIDLAGGDYNIEVTDANGCLLIETYTVQSTALLDVDIDINGICFGETDSGSINITVEGGTEPYAVNWIELGSSDLNLTGLSAGCYNVEISDANGCSFETEVCIEELEELVLQNTTSGNLCFLDLDGQIDLTASGGDPDYTVSWTNENDTFSSEEFNLIDLATGEYTATVTDNSGCETMAVAVITSNPEIEVDLDISPIVCPGDVNGELAVTP
ncbi:MAG: SprB repeat-containing protein, partial [Saprospiraceae bacterium]